jgi:hypothetical protein
MTPDRAELVLGEVLDARAELAPVAHRRAVVEAAPDSRVSTSAPMSFRLVYVRGGTAVPSGRSARSHTKKL